jgi:hypothetical protein
MSNVRRPVSLLTSLSFGLGAALLLLLAASGATPAGAAPAHIGPNPPLPSNCHARNDSNTLLVYDSADSTAVRLAVAAALPNDIVRLAGTCAGVAAGGGTTQTVLINKVLTLVGGFTPTNWVNFHPLTQPTTLDAQGLGRVITASGDITIVNLTVQNGNSSGGDGGGIWDGHNVTALGAVNFLSNTAQVSTTVNGPSDSGCPLCNGKCDMPGGRFGGALDLLGAYVNHWSFKETFGELTDFDPPGKQVYAYNCALYGGAINGPSISVDDVIAQDNGAFIYGGTFNATVLLIVDHTVFIYDLATFGADFASQGQATIANTTSYGSHAIDGGGSGVTLGGGGINLSNVTVSHDTAFRGGAYYFYGTYVTMNDSRMYFDAATHAGGAIYNADSPTEINNSVFIGNKAPEGDAMDVFRSLPNYFRVSSMLDDWVGVPPGTVALDDKASNSPSASAVVSPGEAIFVNGASLFLTDTIVGGYATDLAMGANPSTTVHEDYNLFEHTPVFSGSVTSGGHSLVGDPLFADSLGHLSAGSPAIDHGIDGGINVDFDGNHRPSGAGFDIGAYEYVAALLKLFLPLIRR